MALSVDQELHLKDEDWLWIEKVLQGDSSAFEKIFDKYKIRVINLAFRFVGEKTAAEDVAQEVFLKIYEKKVKVDSKSKFSTWLYRVTVNAALDASRKRKHLPSSLDQEISDREEGSLMDKVHDPNAVNPTLTIAKKELASLIQKEINRLPEKLKLPILLYQFEEMSYREIAGILGITEKAVEKRLSYARDHLKKRLSDYLQ